MIIDKLSLKSDNIGAFASGLCLLHCIATPFIFVMQPLSIQVESAPIWWKSMDFVFLALSFYAVYISARNTSEKWIGRLMWMSCYMLTTAILNEKLEIFSWPELLVYLPAIMLVILHLYNKKYSNCDNEDCKPLHKNR